MTDEERWQIEGRVREELRQARKTLAALRIDIEEHAKTLEEASGSLRHFLSHPTETGPTGMTGLQYVRHFFHAVIPAQVEQRLGEFAKESERVTTLEKRVQEFE